MKEEFKSVILTYQARIRGYIAGLGVPVESVDDIAQETFIQYYENMDKKPDNAATLAWLKGIARNLSFNYFRTQKRMKHHHMKAAEMFEGSETAVIEQKENDDISGALRECIDELPAASRDMVTMKYEQRMRSNTISKKIGKTAQAIRMSLVRIRRALKKCIENKIGGEVGNEL